MLYIYICRKDITLYIYIHVYAFIHNHLGGIVSCISLSTPPGTLQKPKLCVSYNVYILYIMCLMRFRYSIEIGTTSVLLVDLPMVHSSRRYSNFEGIEIAAIFFQYSNLQHYNFTLKF